MWTPLLKIVTSPKPSFWVLQASKNDKVDTEGSFQVSELPGSCKYPCEYPDREFTKKADVAPLYFGREYPCQSLSTSFLEKIEEFQV